MISIVAKFTVNKGDETKFLELIEGLGEASRAEAGCVEYILHKDVVSIHKQNELKFIGSSIEYK